MLYSRKQTNAVQYDDDDGEVIEIAFIVGMTVILSLMLLTYVILW